MEKPFTNFLSASEDFGDLIDELKIHLQAYRAEGGNFNEKEADILLSEMEDAIAGLSLCKFFIYRAKHKGS